MKHFAYICVNFLGDAFVIAASKRCTAATSSNTGNMFCTSGELDLYSLIFMSTSASFPTVKHSSSNLEISF
jgi:hypothetical protein